MDPSTGDGSEPVCKKAKLEIDDLAVVSAVSDPTSNITPNVSDYAQVTSQADENVEATDHIETTTEADVSPSHKPLTEVEAGITEYLNPNTGFRAIIKQRSGLSILTEFKSKRYRA